TPARCTERARWWAASTRSRATSMCRRRRSRAGSAASSCRRSTSSSKPWTSCCSAPSRARAPPRLRHYATNEPLQNRPLCSAGSDCPTLPLGGTSHAVFAREKKSNGHQRVQQDAAESSRGSRRTEEARARAPGSACGAREVDRRQGRAADGGLPEGGRYGARRDDLVGRGLGARRSAGTEGLPRLLLELSPA